MKKTTKVSGLLVVIGLVIIGAFLMPPVAALDQSKVVSDIPSLLSGQQNLTSVEFIVKGQDGSTIWGYRDALICTQAINDIKTGMSKAIDQMESNNVTVVQATVTGDYGKDRTSYDLNLATGKFERLAIPVNIQISAKSAVSAGSLITIRPMLSGLLDSTGHGTPSGRSVTYWAHSVTSPTKTYRVMSTTAQLHYYSNYNWNSIPAQDGATLFSVPYNNIDTSVSGLVPGQYRDEGEFSGVRDDYTNYQEHLIGTQFTIS